MNLLGIDTSTPASAACVLRSDGRDFEAEPAAEALEAPPGHTRELMPAVARCLEAAELDYSELDAVAVGLGPGAFTGLRVGIATARALAQAQGLELRGVSSLAALARGSGARRSLPLIDARRGELFAALYEDGEERMAAFAAPPEEVAARALAAGGDPLAVGNGSIRFRQVLETAGLRVEPPGSRAHVVRALCVCRLAAAAPSTSPEAVLPDYLRLPDAKPR